MGFSLSDEAKVTYLQIKMREARRNQIFSYVIGFVGIFLVDLLFWIWDLPSWNFPIPLDWILGFVVLLIGILVGGYYGEQKKKLMEQLKELAGFTQKPNE